MRLGDTPSSSQIALAPTSVTTGPLELERRIRVHAPSATGTPEHVDHCESVGLSRHLELLARYQLETVAACDIGRTQSEHVQMLHRAE